MARKRATGDAGKSMARKTTRKPRPESVDELLASIQKSAMDESTMDEMQSYVERGRRFQNTELEALKQNWATSLSRWFADPENRAAHLDADDSEAELRLRGLEPPDHLVDADAKEMARARIIQAAEDPAALERLQSALKRVVMNRLRKPPH